MQLVRKRGEWVGGLRRFLLEFVFALALATCVLWLIGGRMTLASLGTVAVGALAISGMGTLSVQLWVRRRRRLAAVGIR